MTASRLAAPSYLWPGTAAENCRWIRRRLPQVEEVGLCLFESEACLAYGEQDLPDSLADAGLGCHLHLPLDIPWNAGFEAGFAVVRGLLAKCAHLSPWAAVLHPPPADMLEAAAKGFAELGWDPSRVLLENVRECDLMALWPRARALGFGVCLDVGHVLAYGQHAMLELPDIFRHIRMLHLHGAGGGFAHASMRRLDVPGRDLTKRLLAATRSAAVRMVEVFDAAGFRESVCFLEELDFSAQT
ncbi:MAG: cobamide remodeling phosphodiesterase CbiR [Desulfovibrionaceae bacterium]